MIQVTWCDWRWFVNILKAVNWCKKSNLGFVPMGRLNYILPIGFMIFWKIYLQNCYTGVPSKTAINLIVTIWFAAFNMMVTKNWDGINNALVQITLKTILFYLFNFLFTINSSNLFPLVPPEILLILTMTLIRYF